jgi:chromosome segregation ATPase
LESIKKTEFGKTILQSLQLELKTGNKDAVDNILTLLNKLRQDEVDAQTTDDANWAAESQECADDQASLQNDINVANGQIDDNNNSIDLLETSVSNNQASLEEANTNLLTSTAALQSLVDARNAEHEQYLSNMADISNTITALQQGKEILNQLVENSDEESGFIQKKGQGSAFAQFTEHLGNAKIQKGKFHGFVVALMNLLNKEIVADQNLLGTVISLIDDLIDQLSDELTTLAANENDAQDIFETQQTNLNSEISNLNAQIADLQAEITNEQNQILDLQNENSNLSLTVANKSQELADRQQTCADDEAAYNDRTEERTAEIDIIDQVIAIFESRFENVRSYIADTTF